MGLEHKGCERGCGARREASVPRTQPTRCGGLSVSGAVVIAQLGEALDDAAKVAEQLADEVGSACGVIDIIARKLESVARLLQ